MRIDDTRHAELISQSPNGLTPYTGYHRCSSGLLRLTNVHIDEDYNVRSYHELTIPLVNLRKKVAVPGLPSPKSSHSDEMKNIKITKLPIDVDLRIVVMDYSSKVRIVIGEIDIDDDNVISVITSDQGTIALFVYPSQIRFTGAIEKWFSIIVNSMETLVPSQLGSIIDVLIYALRNRDEYPVKFEQTLAQTMLTSHEIYFEVLRDLSSELDYYLRMKYEKSDYELMLELISHIEEHPTVPLLKYASTHDGDLVHLISVFLMLELEGIVQIHRPGIIEII